MRFSVVVSVFALAMGAAFDVCAQAPNPAVPPIGPHPPARLPAARARATSSGTIELTDEGELAKVVGLYEAGKYVECASALKVLLDPKSRQRLRDRAVVENARIYHAACLIGSGKVEAADEPLRAAIRDNLQMKQPDSLVFPPPVVDRFLQVRQSLNEEIRRAEDERLRKARAEAGRRLERERAEIERVATLEELATRQLVVTKNRRWVGFLPFGAGQFQNDNEGLGWVFLTSEAVLSATALTALGVSTHFHRRATELRNPSNNAVVKTWYTLFQVNSYSFLAVYALGVLEAQLSFVPEFRETRVRPLPPKLRRNSSTLELRPDVTAGPDGAVLGISGKF
jgi:hypothetical protein